MSSTATPVSTTSTIRVRRPRRARIGDYEIVGAPVGRGGMATVYRVQDGRGRMFAIKELLPHNLPSREMVRRFQQEYEIASELRHPGILRLYDLFEENGTWNILMELVQGPSLKRLLSRTGKMPVPMAAAAARRAAEALAYAHSRGVVHRDVKPDNLLFGPDGLVKVADFGIALLGDLRMTGTGVMLGTPAYMAPEQLAGKGAARVGPAADVYSLGAVLYEMVTRKLPHGLGRKAELIKVIYAKNFEAVRPLPGTLPEPFRDLVLSCLERAPESRPASMSDLEGALARLAGRGDTNRELLERISEAAKKERRKPRKAGRKPGSTKSRSNAEEASSNDSPPGRAAAFARKAARKASDLAGWKPSQASSSEWYSSPWAVGAIAALAAIVWLLALSGPATRSRNAPNRPFPTLTISPGEGHPSLRTIGGTRHSPLTRRRAALLRRGRAHRGVPRRKTHQ